ncbi:hypothetical protein LAZ67_16002070 [Cordylochernes scorpioides]|uniref:Uncharacterized protein n=1 Tax=Cordylochernes scorpioides TaxID=51811 RepID=A0ABY6LFA3_9ARAC|nr:hypothetical protein LAZ67_16002070 [Cordylochernes scorpioides]
MDLEVIENFKRYCRKELLRTVLMEENYEKKAVYISAETWATLKDTTLAKLGISFFHQNNLSLLLKSYQTANLYQSWRSSLQNLLYNESKVLTKEKYSVFEECDQKNIEDWLECDVDDPGYQLLTDDEIIESFIDDQGSSDSEEELRDDDQNKTKAWIVLFSCAVFRALHMELVTSLSTEAFIQALRRFIARNIETEKK